VTKVKRYLKIALFAFIGVAILWYITKGQDVERIWLELINARLIWVFLAILAGGISHYLRALRWNLLLNSMGYSTHSATTFYVLMTGYLANLAVPRLGEVTRCGTLSRYSRIPFNAVAGTVVAERVFDMLCLGILIFLTILFQFSFLKDFLDYYVFTPVTEMVQGKVWALVVIATSGLAAFIMVLRYFKRVSSDKKSLSGKIKRQLQGFWQGMISLAMVENKILFLVHTVFIWFLYFLMVYLCFFAIDATSSLGIADGLTVLSLGSLGVVAPVPGGIGAYHFIVIKTLTELFGIESEPATSYAYLAHAAQMVLVLLLGAWSWFALSTSFKEPEKIQTSTDHEKT
jgi:glycosyltransferase 2 family protein